MWWGAMSMQQHHFDKALPNFMNRHNMCKLVGQGLCCHTFEIRRQGGIKKKTHDSANPISTHEDEKRPVPKKSSSWGLHISGGQLDPVGGAYPAG